MYSPQAILMKISIPVYTGKRHKKSPSSHSADGQCGEADHVLHFGQQAFAFSQQLVLDSVFPHEPFLSAHALQSLHVLQMQAFPVAQPQSLPHEQAFSAAVAIPTVATASNIASNFFIASPFMITSTLAVMRTL
jgi:hypothetical protein